MDTYLVKAKNDAGDNYLIIVAAENRKDLFWGIDEFIDPYACVYKKIGRKLSGGLVCLKVIERKEVIEGCDVVNVDIDNNPEREIDKPEFGERISLSYFEDDWKHFEEGFRSI